MMKLSYQNRLMKMKLSFLIVLILTFVAKYTQSQDPKRKEFHYIDPDEVNDLTKLKTINAIIGHDVAVVPIDSDEIPSEVDAVLDKIFKFAEEDKSEEAFREHLKDVLKEEICAKDSKTSVIKIEKNPEHGLPTEDLHKLKFMKTLILQSGIKGVADKGISSINDLCTTYINTNMAQQQMAQITRVVAEKPEADQESQIRATVRKTLKQLNANFHFSSEHSMSTIKKNLIKVIRDEMAKRIKEGLKSPEYKNITNNLSENQIDALVFKAIKLAKVSINE